MNQMCRFDVPPGEPRLQINLTGGRIPTEHEEQRAFVSWFRKTFTGVLIAAIPNGGQRSKSQGAKLMLEGVLPGMPDLFIPAWGLFIEFKRRKGGSLSPEQKEVIPQLEAAGYRVIVAKGCHDAVIKLREFGKCVPTS